MEEMDFQSTFDLFLDDDDSGYDALADLQPDEDEDDYDPSDGQGGPIVDEQVEMRKKQRRVDNRSVPEKIDGLFESMAPRRRVLLGILRFLQTPQRSDALKEKVEELQTYDKSVYDGYNFSRLLARSGAIKKVNEDGSDIEDEDAEQAPDIVEIDGVKYYKPTDGKQVYWVNTPEGQAKLEEDDPYGRFQAMLLLEPQYLGLYKEILEFCNVETGRTAKELEDLINPKPITLKPHRFSNYWVKRLEDCGALYWHGQWDTSEVGLRGLAELFGALDEVAAEEEAEVEPAEDAAVEPATENEEGEE